MSETLKACASAAMVLIGTVAGAIGFELDGDMLTNVVSAACVLIATAWGVWHNHNFTKAAQEGQKVVDELKCWEEE